MAPRLRALKPLGMQLCCYLHHQTFDQEVWFSSKISLLIYALVTVLYHTAVATAVYQWLAQG